MKYFGKKSFSSWISRLLHIAWYVVLVGSILATIVGSALFVVISLGNALNAETDKETVSFCGNDMKTCFKDMKPDDLDQLKNIPAKIRESVEVKDRKAFETFINLPLFVKFLIFPYFWVVIVFLLRIIKHSQYLFTNFKNDIVFNKNNVALISKIAKLNIVFSILTLSISSLLTSVFLLMVCEIFKNGDTSGRA